MVSREEAIYQYSTCDPENICHSMILQTLQKAIPREALPIYMETESSRAHTLRFFDLGHRIAQIEFNKSIAGCYRDGKTEYDAVGVLLLTWVDDDMNCKEREVNDLEKVFSSRFNYHTEQYEIPSKDSRDLLLSRMKAFLRCYDSPNKMSIIYYGGHARTIVEGDDLELFPRITPKASTEDPNTSNQTDVEAVDMIPSPLTSPTTVFQTFQDQFDKTSIRFTEMCELVQNSDVDTLLIIDCCYAAKALNRIQLAGRKCELFCSISEGQVARAAGQEGSFTKVLTDTLAKMIQNDPNGVSTKDLYNAIYLKQHHNYKPLLFDQSKFDFGKIWLRPLPNKVSLGESRQLSARDGVATESKYSIDVRFQLTKGITLVELNHLAKKLQYIPHVQRIDFQSMHSPLDDLEELLRTIRAASRLRPLLSRIRERRELRQRRQIRRTDTSPPSPIATTRDQFLSEKPRNVELFDWTSLNDGAETLRVLQNPAPVTSNGLVKLRTPKNNIEDGNQDVAPKLLKKVVVRNIALKMYGWVVALLEGHKRNRGGAITWTQALRLSQQARRSVIYFALGLIASRIFGGVIQGSAAAFGFQARRLV
ncbi:hypothetical protein CC78DRAFT_206179 [Lojkania enalia]|uniref:Uncharacterized protein n=1 Tax=Lojkania enalia TaxID=147567 RepID=A0A9P4JXQ5_9PLEO|nr:hypothetical protein CC78DRAFT_206179 [Didymosphaeria enalia]